MIRNTAILLIFLVSILAMAITSSYSAGLFAGKVVGITDGDTIKRKFTPSNNHKNLIIMQ